MLCSLVVSDLLHASRGLKTERPNVLHLSRPALECYFCLPVGVRDRPTAEVLVTVTLGVLRVLNVVRTGACDRGWCWWHVSASKPSVPLKESCVRVCRVSEQIRGPTFRSRRVRIFTTARFGKCSPEISKRGRDSSIRQIFGRIFGSFFPRRCEKVSF